MLERLERQERLTANQWKIIATAGVGDMLDFFDFFLIGYVLAFVLKDWHLTYGQSAMILVSAGLGAVPGAFFWGWMGDLIGRRRVFILTALNVALAWWPWNAIRVPPTTRVAVNWISASTRSIMSRKSA